MRVAVLIPKLLSPHSPDERDTVEAAEMVVAALKGLGHTPFQVELTIDDRGIRLPALSKLAPNVVFNLLEDVGGRFELNYLGALLLELLNLPFTGCPSRACILTQDKVVTKTILHNAGILTPDWYWAGVDQGAQERNAADQLFLIKPVACEASIGLHEDKLIFCRGSHAANAHLARLDPSWFAERYIDGREFNISVIECADGPQVLPPAEIIFDGYDCERPRVVGYKAKWEVGSFEFVHTRRSFDSHEKDNELLLNLSKLAKRCWSLFDLEGYARIDFRIDHQGCPWVLEINANPGIGPDSGFVAAAARAGISYQAMVEQILTSALANNPEQ